MARCDLCGTEDQLMKAIIEGAKVNVCKNCASFGKVLEKPQPVFKEKPKENKIEQVEMLVPGFNKIIRQKREALGLSQKDFAAKISEKESFLHKMETGELSPSIETAKKLERILNIRLVESYAEESSSAKEKKSEGLTIGDMIKLK